MQTDLEFRPRTTIDSNGSRWSPLPPCPHCDPTATPPSECGRH